MAALKHKPHFGIFHNMHFLPSWKLFPNVHLEWCVSDSKGRRKSKLYYNALGIATELGESKPNAMAVCTGCNSNIWKKVQVNIYCNYIGSTETNNKSAESP